MSNAPQAASFADAYFLRDIEKHELTVIRDDGLNRHLRFKRPGTYCMHFDLITWPGYLCYTGDMGTYVFKRLDDMLQFFRRDHSKDPYRIDFRYWAEKVEAADVGDGVLKFSEDKFRDRITDRFNTWADDNEVEAAARAELWSDVRADVLDALDDDSNGTAAYRAAMDLEWHGMRPFSDFWEVDCREFTHRFLWCCHALAWGIKVYDDAKARTAVPA